MIKTSMLKTASLFVALTGSLAGGCATDDEYAENAQFGNAVRHTIALQTSGASHYGTGLDGKKALATFDAYQKDVAKPKDAEKPLIFKLNQ